MVRNIIQFDMPEVMVLQRLGNADIIESISLQTNCYTEATMDKLSFHNGYLIHNNRMICQWYITLLVYRECKLPTMALPILIPIQYRILYVVFGMRYASSASGTYTIHLTNIKTNHCSTLHIDTLRTIHIIFIVLMVRNV